MRNGTLGDKYVGKLDNTGGLPGHTPRSISVADDAGEVVPPVRYAYRSFDRQYLIPDKRLINQANPTLWETHSERQVYLTALTRHSPTSGPAVTFTGLIPDIPPLHGFIRRPGLPAVARRRRPCVQRQARLAGGAARGVREAM